MAEHYIFHIDVNSAFLSWSALQALEEDPGSVDLRTIPSAVGGDVRTRHGIITAKSIPAKKYGVKTGEPVVTALQKCPNLVVVPGNFELYRAYSRAFIRILHNYTDRVQQVSIDEAYLDMTEAGERLASGGDLTGEGRRTALYFLAVQIKDRIREELGFTVNVGISTNKLLAKTASDFTKPDRVHTLYEEEIPEKFWPMSIGELYGCGPSTAARLMGMGIRTIGDAAHTAVEILCGALGEKAGIYIHESANGRGSTAVHVDPWEAKSISNETTLARDITAENFETDLPPVLERLSRKVAGRLQKEGVLAGGVGVMVKTSAFRRHSRQRLLGDPTNDAEEIYAAADRLMRELLLDAGGVFSAAEGVRLVGISTAELTTGEFRQLSFFDKDLLK